VRVIKPSTVKAYGRQHPAIDAPLRAWLKLVKNREWSSLADVRRDFPHADGVVVKSGNTVTVFNIGGNKYRLIVAMKYQYQRVYVLRCLTHAEYDKDKWKEQL
jgi:mRNA interferase HigB